MYKRDPPSGYQEPAADIRAQFQEVLSNISSGAYATEYAFQANLVRTFNSAHDGHFRFSPDLLTKAISFGRTVPLVSVSLDGIKAPKVYAQRELLAYSQG